MTANSNVASNDVLITQEKMYTKRTNIHKHFMLCCALVHFTLIVLCVLQIIFGFDYDPKNASCNALKPLTMNMYVLANIGFFVMFVNLYKNADYHASGISRLQAYNTNINRLF